MSMIILIAERVDVKTKTVAIDHHRNQTVHDDKRHIYQEASNPHVYIRIKNFRIHLTKTYKAKERNPCHS